MFVPRADTPTSTMDPRVSSLRTTSEASPAMSTLNSHSAMMPSQQQSSDLARIDDDDPLEAGVRMEPLRDLTRREEDARLVMEGHAGGEDHGSVSYSGAPRKRGHGEEDTGRERLVKRKGDLSKSFLDPVQLGLCSEEHGRTLFESYFEHSHPFMPVMDPETDTWSS
jgi:hypothetical protein